MNLPRQPRPIKITLEGESEDIDAWIEKITRGFTGDIDRPHRNIIKLYPRAVND